MHMVSQDTADGRDEGSAPPRRRGPKPRPFTVDDPRHGTVNGYVNLGCRQCQPCRDAWSAYIAERRTQRTPPPPGDPRHGRRSTYDNYQCRCELCSNARSEYERAYRAAVSKTVDDSATPLGVAVNARADELSW